MGHLDRRQRQRAAVRSVWAVIALVGVCATGPLPRRLEAQTFGPPTAGPSPDANEALRAGRAVFTYSSPSSIGIPGTGTFGIAGAYPATLTVPDRPNIGRLEVRLNGLTHSAAADLDILLVGPRGQTVMLMSDAGGSATIDNAFITFADGAPALESDQPITSGTFAPTNLAGAADPMPGPAPPGPYGTSLATFIGTRPDGVWSLYVVDDLGNSVNPGVGRLPGFSLLISDYWPQNTPLPITDLTTVESTLRANASPGAKLSVSMYVTHTFDADLDVSLVAPDGSAVLLTSDNGGGADDYGTSCAPEGMAVFDDAAPTAIVAGAAPFVGRFQPQQPLATFADRRLNGEWKLRITDDAGTDVGVLNCWALAVENPQPPPSAAGLTLSRLTGNLATFTWVTSPAGPAPTAFSFVGGVIPGQTLASVRTPIPSLTLAMPNGTFFVRVVSEFGNVATLASEELPVYVNVPAPPSAPTTLLLTANGTTLDLTWRNDFATGTPSHLLLEVSGAANLNVPLPVTERFSFSGVPPGTYSFAVRAVNGAGASPRSNVRSATFPSACSGPPQSPTRFRAYSSGTTAFADWELPLSGPSVSHYVLSVTGSIAATLPTALRGVSGAVPPGTYNLSVVAVNPCGASLPTAVKTLVIL